MTPFWTLSLCAKGRVPVVHRKETAMLPEKHKTDILTAGCPRQVKCAYEGALTFQITRRNTVTAIKGGGGLPLCLKIKFIK